MEEDMYKHNIQTKEPCFGKVKMNILVVKTNLVRKKKGEKKKECIL